MQVDQCPAIGPYCISLRTSASGAVHQPVDSRNIIMTQPIQANNLRKITPIGDVIQIIRQRGSTLADLHAQPRDLTILGIPTDQLEQLELVVARHEGRQRRIDQQDLAAEAQAELELSKEMAKSLRPVARAAAKGELKAEPLCKALNSQADPIRARRVLYTILTTTAPVFAGNEVAEMPVGADRKLSQFCR